MRLSVVWAGIFFLSDMVCHPVLRSKQLAFYTRLCNPRASALGQPRLAQEFRRLFGRSRVDVESASPFETRNLRQFRNNLKMPVVICQRRLLHGRAVQDTVIRRPLENLFQFANGGTQDPR